MIVAVTFTDIDCDEARLPLFEDTASHAPPKLVVAVACQLRVPPPVLVIVIAWLAGWGWPTVALKPMVEGAVVRIGVVGCPTVKLTGKVWVPVAELKKMEPL